MWFEILSFPQSFQKGGHCTVAKYTMTDKGYVKVVNTCLIAAGDPFKAGFMIR